MNAIVILKDFFIFNFIIKLIILNTVKDYEYIFNFVIFTVLKTIDILIINSRFIWLILINKYNLKQLIESITSK